MSGRSQPSRPVLDPARSRALLERVIERAREVGDHAIVVFDLDSTLLDNRPRQAQILREYGVENAIAALAGHGPEQWQGWDARVAMANAGLTPDLIAAHFAPFRAYWKQRFFTSAYCVLDEAIEGATDYVTAVRRAGARVFYVTGRHDEMRAGTVSCFARLGLPVPDGLMVDLLMKPTFDEHDDLYKLGAYARLRERGVVIAAFDNEPTHINGYLEAFPDALVVHLATDHSMREVAVADGIPSIASFAAFAKRP